MKSLDEFRQFFASTLRRELEVAESARKQTILRAVLAGVITLLVMVLVPYAITQAFGTEYAVGVIILNVLVFSALGYMVTREILSSRGFYNLFKARVIEGIIQFIDNRLRYIPHRHLSPAVLVKSRLFSKNIHEFEGDDYCFMQLSNGTFVEFSEVHAKTKVRDQSEKHMEPIFDGLFAHIHCTEGRIGDLYIVPKGTDESQLSPHQAGKLQHFNTENSEFEEYFTVYGTSSVAARRYITPALMSALVEFRRSHPDRLVYYASHGSEVYIGVTSESHLFEPNVWKPLTDVKSLEKFFEDFNDFFGLLHAAADLSGEPIRPEAQPTT